MGGGVYRVSILHVKGVARGHIITHAGHARRHTLHLIY